MVYGIFDLMVFHLDYEVILTIPKGSTFINITIETPKRYYYGLRKIGSSSVNLNVKSEMYYLIENNTFHFHKKTSENQEIASDGPLKDSFELVVSELLFRKIFTS